MLAPAVIRKITARIGAVNLAATRAVAGGSINQSFRVAGVDGQLFFLKINQALAIEMFAAERAGLAELRGAKAVRVPEVFLCEPAGEFAILLLEHLDLEKASRQAAIQLGKSLALQHQFTSTKFGWHRNNTIGATPQINHPADSWVEFFRDHRLGYQFRLAAKNGFDDESCNRLQAKGRILMERLPAMLDGHTPEPSLLHGDLWAGNWGALTDGRPVIFDPAVYYGDREADIAMTRLFGGFGSEFYSAYQSVLPMPAGFEWRSDLYNLYHVLNHLNLFGRGYLGQASDMLDRLLTQQAL